MSENTISTDPVYEEAMPDMGSDEYEALKESVSRHGIDYPILIDKNNKIIDGHHRYRAWEELGKDEDPPTIVVDTEADIERALRPNLARRDFSSGQKREAVKRYLERHYDGERTQREVARDLGVSQKTIDRAIDELEADGKMSQMTQFSKAEKRQQVREYIDGNPDASNREVARGIEGDVSHATVGNWRGGDDGGGGEEAAGMTAYATDSESREAATELFKAKESDDDAREIAEDVARGKQNPTDAKKELDSRRRRGSDDEPVTETPEVPDDTYRTVVVDPPWPVEKIGRRERPDQGRYLDYPTMEMSDILSLPVPELAADSGAHIYLWSTQKHLPTAFECLSEWGARYECLMTWVKPTGVAPFSWQYNTEHVLFARYGDGLDLKKNGQQLSFEAPVTKHSEKPELFYDRVRTASPDPRLEMFARDGRDGFDVWGDEV